MNPDAIARIKEFIAKTPKGEWQTIKFEEPSALTWVRLVGENMILQARVDAQADRIKELEGQVRELESHIEDMVEQSCTEDHG